ncbi:MAG: hypothetical protein ACNA7Z_04480 [Dethiobacteria bacterium]|nr:hypothetical protein [Bacillota bacterium]
MISDNLKSNLLLLEYCYCNSCMRIKGLDEIITDDEGNLLCSHCGSRELDEPGWVICPHQKMTAVKCPRAGKGIISNGSGLECSDRCFFR